MDSGEFTYEDLLNSPSRGNLVDGLPRAASDCWVGEYLNSNYGDIRGTPWGVEVKHFYYFLSRKCKYLSTPYFVWAETNFCQYYKE